jgi:hypothetical protein
MPALAPDQMILDSAFRTPSLPSGMRVDRELTILRREREAQKARSALEYDRYSPIERLDLLRRIRASWVKTVTGQMLYRIIVRESSEADLNEPPKKFVPTRTAATKSVQAVARTIFAPGDGLVDGLYVIFLSPSIFECLTKGNPFGKSTLSHEFFHIWEHRRLIEKIGQLSARAKEGDRPAGQQLHDILTNRNHKARFDCDSQADALAASFSMPAEGLQFLENISTREPCCHRNRCKREFSQKLNCLRAGF